jgi:hypothetical protein
MTDATKKAPVGRIFNTGDRIGYCLRDFHGVTMIAGTVTGYGRGTKTDWVILDVNGTSIMIPQHVPVKLPTVWADSLNPAY